jgi:hypothetical protein
VREKYIKRKYAQREFVRPYTGVDIAEVTSAPLVAVVVAVEAECLTTCARPCPCVQRTLQDFTEALHRGDLHDMLRLLVQGASPNCGTPPALMEAARLNDSTLVEFLIQVRRPSSRRLLHATLRRALANALGVCDTTERS